MGRGFMGGEGGVRCAAVLLTQTESPRSYR